MNKDQAKLIKLFYDNEEIFLRDFNKYGITANSDLFDNLYNKLHLLEQGTIGIQETVNGYEELCTMSIRISDKGKEEYEKYCSLQNAEKREIETLQISKEANEIAKQANQKSDRSNRIAIWSIIFAVISILVSVAAIIIPLITNTGE